MGSTTHFFHKKDILQNTNRYNIIIYFKQDTINNSLQKITPYKLITLFKKILSISNIGKNNKGVDNKSKMFTFLNKFLLNFLENFLKTPIIINIKKGSCRLPIKRISYRKFFLKYFKKNLKVSKQVVGILYYSILLKDASIFANFLKKIFEKTNIKLHKKILLGLKKLIKEVFKPLFNYLNLVGLLFNIKGKIGVSGNAKKRRYFFYFGGHSLTTRTLKVDLKFLPIWTFTGTMGFTFYLFF